MKLTILSKKEFLTTNWAGGTTTQLFIYPSLAEYRLGNFDFRLSSATVELEKSEFTSLPGISRKLMILEGEIWIEHQNHHSKKLAKFDWDEFDGAWKTSSVVLCTDFNIMTAQGFESQLNSMLILENTNENYSLKSTHDFVFIYAFKGEVKLSIGSESNLLREGELAVLENLGEVSMDIMGIIESELVFSLISKTKNT